MSFVDKFIAEILALEVGLYHAYARMEARTDTEALHDLRINLRRIRSLLRPLRDIEGIAGLNEAAADVGRLTTPVRDLEMLIEELEARGFVQLAQTRKARLDSSYKHVVKNRSRSHLFAQLDEWTSTFRSAERAGELNKIEKKIAGRLQKQIERLKAALADSQYDRHQLRVLVKRTRYLSEAFPQLSLMTVDAAAALKSVQSALGSWHDHFQWCLKAEEQEDLQPLKHNWQTAASAALSKAEAQLTMLLGLLSKT